MTRDRMTWIASTARLSGREIKADKRLEKRIAELEGTGLSKQAAGELARQIRSSGGTRSHPNVGHETLSVPGHQLALVGRSVSAGTECVAATCRISKEKAPPKRG